VTWSPGHIDVAIQSLLFQIYPILLSTLLSINRQQLSLFDVSFALAVSSSPLTVYLVVASICDFFGINTNLYKRIKSYRLMIRALGALVLLLWIGLNMTYWMSTGAFIDSSCYPGSFKDWLKNTCLSLITSFVSGRFISGFTLILALPWFFCLARRWSQLKADVRLHSNGVHKLLMLWTWAKCAWCVPINVGSRLAKSNAIKVHHRPQA